jgi:hypothetical protein
MPQTKLSPEIIAAAIRGFEAQKEQIDHQIAELMSGVNYFFALTTIISPYQRQLLFSS